jgi:hypothetical protein
LVVDQRQVMMTNGRSRRRNNAARKGRAIAALVRIDHDRALAVAQAEDEASVLALTRRAADQATEAPAPSVIDVGGTPVQHTTPNEYLAMLRQLTGRRY